MIKITNTPDINFPDEKFTQYEINARNFCSRTNSIESSESGDINKG